MHSASQYGRANLECQVLENNSAWRLASRWTFQANVLRLGHGRTRVFPLPGGRVQVTNHGTSTSGDARDEELRCYVSRSETMHEAGSESQERTTSPGSTPSPFRRRLTQAPLSVRPLSPDRCRGAVGLRNQSMLATIWGRGQVSGHASDTDSVPSLHRCRNHVPVLAKVRVGNVAWGAGAQAVNGTLESSQLYESCY